MNLRRPHGNNKRSASVLAARLAQCRADWLPRYFPAGKLRAGVFELGSADGDAGRSFPIPLCRQPHLVDFAGDFRGDDSICWPGRSAATIKAACREAMAYLGLGAKRHTPRQPEPRPPPMPAGPTTASTRRSCGARPRRSATASSAPSTCDRAASIAGPRRSTSTRPAISARIGRRHPRSWRRPTIRSPDWCARSGASSSTTRATSFGAVAMAPARAAPAACSITGTATSALPKASRTRSPCTCSAACRAGPRSLPAGCAAWSCRNGSGA